MHSIYPVVTLQKFAKGPSIYLRSVAWLRAANFIKTLNHQYGSLRWVSVHWIEIFYSEKTREYIKFFSFLCTPISITDLCELKQSITSLPYPLFW